MIIQNILETIGNTPLLKLADSNTNQVYIKLEKFNPGTSVKDRAVAQMIEDLEASGGCHPHDTFVEATSGNTGIALAMIGAAKGYHVIIVMPETMSIERRQLMSAYGAELVLTSGALGMKGSLDKMNEILKENPSYKTLKQFENSANVKAHALHTAKEIFDDLKQIDYLVLTVGTGGTLSGIAQTAKTINPEIQIVAVEPTGSPFLSKQTKGAHKIQGIGAGFKPDILRDDLIDAILCVSDEDAYATCKDVAQHNGLLLGISSGAALYASLELAKTVQGKVIVTLAPDGGEKYCSVGVFD